MAKNIRNEATDVETDALTQIGTVDGPAHLGSGDQINATQTNGDGATVINGDHTHNSVSHTFNK